MDVLLIVFSLIILLIVSLIGGTIFFVYLLINKIRKNAEEYRDFASKIMISMIGGLIMFLATQLKGVYPTDIGGVILYSGIFFFMFLLLYFSFSIYLYIIKFSKTKKKR